MRSAADPSLEPIGDDVRHLDVRVVTRRNAIQLVASRAQGCLNASSVLAETCIRLVVRGMWVLGDDRDRPSGRGRVEGHES